MTGLNLEIVQMILDLDVIYWVVVATQHCQIAFTELDTNLGKKSEISQILTILQFY